jgi:hypothetical protein
LGAVEVVPGERVCWSCPRRKLIMDSPLVNPVGPVGPEGVDTSVPPLPPAPPVVAATTETPTPTLDVRVADGAPTSLLAIQSRFMTSAELEQL